MVSRTKRTQKKTQSRRKIGKRVRGGVWYNPLSWSLFSQEPKPTDDAQNNMSQAAAAKPNEEEKAATAPPTTPTTPTPTTPTTPTTTPTASMGGWTYGKKKAKEHSVYVNHKKANSKSRSRSRSARR